MEYLHKETRNGYTLTVEYEMQADDPQNWGVFKMHIWNGRFDNDLVTGDAIEDFQTENEKWTPGTRSKLRVGILQPVQVRSYSNSDGGFYTLTDLEDADGFIELVDAKGLQPYERELLAKSCLSEYQQWANGEVYRADIVDDDTGEWVDGGGDSYGLQETIDQGIAALDNLVPKRDSARAKNASEVHA